MREIKFRAWDKQKNCYYPHDCMEGLGGFYYSYGLNPVEDDFELQQYTGLKDRNGKEIYEFDYLKIPEVNDNSKFWCVFWGSGKYILHNISTGDIIDCNEQNTITKEVAGNRYETPREHKAMETDL